MDSLRPELMTINVLLYGPSPPKKEPRAFLMALECEVEDLVALLTDEIFEELCTTDNFAEERQKIEFIMMKVESEA